MKLKWDALQGALSTVASRVVDGQDQDLDAVAIEAIGIIRRRTTKDRVDVDGAPFEPYSAKPCYISLDHRPKPKGGQKTPRTKGATTRAANKAGVFNFSISKTGKMKILKKGLGKSVFYARGYRQYKEETQGVTAPNLEATGEMFNSLTFRRNGPGSRLLYFATQATGVRAAGLNERRKFFGLSRKELQDLGDLYKRRRNGK